MAQYLSEVRLYEAEFPPERKPPAVAVGDGSRLLEAREPVYTVDLDAGAFRAVWELLESEAKHRYPTKNIMSSARAYLRAVDSFRSVWWSHHTPPEPTGSRRRLIRPGRRLKSATPPATKPAPGSKRVLVRRKSVR